MATSRETLAIQLTLTGATVAGAALRTVSGAISGIGRVLSGANSGLFFLTNNLSAAARAGRALSSSLLTPNIDFETATLQFETLLGSADAADRRIRELFEYARSTPFTNQQVLHGGRLLELFGGQALGAGQGLRMVGDMASAVAADFGEVSMWVGRAYDAIQSGRPWGEAAMRLQELGLMSGASRARLEALAGAGADGAVIWRAFQGEMSRFGGAAARLGDTFAGVASTISGQWGEIRRVLGEGLFLEVRDDLTNIRNAIQSAFDDGTIQRMGSAVRNFTAALFESFGGTSTGQWGIKNIANGIAYAMYDLTAAVQRGDLAGALVDSFKARTDDLTTWLGSIAATAGQRFVDGLRGRPDLTFGERAAVNLLAPPPARNAPEPGGFFGFRHAGMYTQDNPAIDTAVEQAAGKIADALARRLEAGAQL